jgi:hypothetical protein
MSDKPGPAVKRPTQLPPVNQEEENRKLLENLQMRKNILQQSAVARPPVTPAGRIVPPASTVSLGQANQLLSEAHSSSLGYYVVTDSKFGNSILPAIPRYKQP